MRIQQKLGLSVLGFAGVMAVVSWPCHHQSTGQNQSINDFDLGAMPDSVNGLWQGWMSYDQYRNDPEGKKIVVDRLDPGIDLFQTDSLHPIGVIVINDKCAVHFYWDADSWDKGQMIAVVNTDLGKAGNVAAIYSLQPNDIIDGLLEKLIQDSGLPTDHLRPVDLEKVIARQDSSDTANFPASYGVTPNVFGYEKSANGTSFFAEYRDMSGNGYVDLKGWPNIIGVNRNAARDGEPQISLYFANPALDPETNEIRLSDQAGRENAINFWSDGRVTTTNKPGRMAEIVNDKRSNETTLSRSRPRWFDSMFGYYNMRDRLRD